MWVNKMIVGKVTGQNLSLGPTFFVSQRQMSPEDRESHGVLLCTPYFSKRLLCRLLDLVSKTTGCANAIFGTYLY